MSRIFILSPARTSGKRAAMLMSDRAEFDLARRLRTREGASLGEVFSFLSGLYFRGKLNYSKHFARPPAGLTAHYVITSDGGLMDAEYSVSLPRLKAFGTVEIYPREPLYAEPLKESVFALKKTLPAECEVVLLGSIATNKYAEILMDAFGKHLLFPLDFIGRGDMSRGGLLLRAVKADAELCYIALSEAESRRGQRPPKLPRETK